jgi:hypothetical protein
MVEFASVSESTGYAPFELSGGYMPSMIKEIQGDEVFAKGVKLFVATTLQNLADMHDAIIEARTFQTDKANERQRDEPEITVGDLVYLSTKNLNLPQNHTRKLCSNFIGPYKVAESQAETSNYKLELPTALQARRINAQKRKKAALKYPLLHLSYGKSTLAVLPHMYTRDYTLTKYQPGMGHICGVILKTVGWCQK